MTYCAIYHLYIITTLAIWEHFGNNKPTDYLHYCWKSVGCLFYCQSW